MTNVIVSMPTVHTLQHVNGVTDGCCISASPMFLVHGLTFVNDVDAVLIRSARTRAPQVQMSLVCRAVSESALCYVQRVGTRNIVYVL